MRARIASAFFQTACLAAAGYLAFLIGHFPGVKWSALPFAWTFLCLLVFLSMPLGLLALTFPGQTRDTLERGVLRFGIAPFRLFAGVILYSALLFTLLIHLPYPVRLVAFAVFAPAFIVAFIFPGMIFGPYRHLRPPPRKPMPTITPAAYQKLRGQKGWRLFQANMLLLGVFFVTGCWGFFLGHAIPTAEWNAMTWQIAPFYALAANLVWSVAVWRIRREDVDDLSRYWPDIFVKVLMMTMMVAFLTYYSLARFWPAAWNWLSGAPQVTRQYTVAGAEMHSGLRHCGQRMVLFLDDRHDSTIFFCNFPSDLIRASATGDRIEIIGEFSYFGMTMEKGRLLKPDR